VLEGDGSQKHRNCHFVFVHFVTERVGTSDSPLLSFLPSSLDTLCRLSNRLSQIDRIGKPEVCVMAHGWRRFHQLFGSSDLCEYD